MIKSFSLGAKKYRVVKRRDDGENLGTASSPRCELTIQEIWGGKHIPEISQEQTLFHEVVHCILDEIAREELNRDESFVQSFGLLMHQFFKTAK